MMEYTENYDNTIIYQCKYGVETNNGDVDVKYVKLYNYISETYGNIHTFQNFPPRRDCSLTHHRKP